MGKKEILVLIILVVISFLSILIINLSKNNDAPTTVLVLVGDEVYREIPLTAETNEEFRVDTEHGYNIIKISNLQVEVIEADCDDQICVNSVSASKKGDIIVCLPHKVIVELN